MSNVKALFFWRKFLSSVDIGPKKEKHGRKSWEGTGDKTPEYGVGALTQSVPQDFQKNTAQSSPKQIISSGKIYLWTGGIEGAMTPLQTPPPSGGAHHGRKSRGTGGTRPPRICTEGDGNDVRPPEFSTYNVLNNAVCHLFILICTRYNVLHCI